MLHALCRRLVTSIFKFPWPYIKAVLAAATRHCNPGTVDDRRVVPGAGQVPLATISSVLYVFFYNLVCITNFSTADWICRFEVLI